MSKVALAIAVVKFALKVFAFVRQREGEAALRELDAHFDSWAAAKTKQEKLDAATQIADDVYKS